MKRAKVSFIYEGRGRRRTREEKDYISRKARIIRARARKYGYQSSINLNPLYFYTTAVMVEGQRDEHEVAMATAITAAAATVAQEDDDGIILEPHIIESYHQERASHVSPFCFSTTRSHAVKEKGDEREENMVIAVDEEDDDDVIIIETTEEEEEEAIVINPKVVNEDKKNIVEDGESGENEFKAAIEAEAKMIIDGMMMEKWEGEGPGQVWWEEQLPLTCTYEEEWMWGSKMGTDASSSGLNGKDGRAYWEVMSDLGFANGAEKDKWDEYDDIWNLTIFKDITNSL